MNKSDNKSTQNKQNIKNTEKNSAKETVHTDGKNKQNNSNNRKNQKNQAHSSNDVKNSRQIKSQSKDFVNSEEFNKYVEPLPDNIIRAKKRRERIVDDEPEIKAEPASAQIPPDITKKENEDKSQTEKVPEKKSEGTASSVNKKTVIVTVDKKNDNKENQKAVPKKSKDENSVRNVKVSESEKSLKNNKNHKKASTNQTEHTKKKSTNHKADSGKKGRNTQGKKADDVINLDAVRREREKEKQKKRLKRCMIAGVILLLGLLAYLLRGYWVPELEGIFDKPHETIVNEGKTEKGNFPIKTEKNTDMSISQFGNYFITVDKNHILMYDESGEQSGSFTHNYSTPVLKTSRKRIMVYDYGGNSFRIMNSKKEIYTKNTEKNILMGAVADNGNALVVTQSEKYECKMLVFDSAGSEIFTWEGGKIVNVSFTNGGNSCAVCTFTSEGGQIKSVIYVLDFNKKKPEMKSEVLPTLALDVQVAEDKGYFVVGDDCFYKLNSDGKIYFKYEYSGKIDDYTLGEKGAAVSCKGNSSNGENILFFKSGDNEYPTNSVKSENGLVKKSVYSEQGFILLENGTMEAYDFSGNLIATAVISQDYTDFAFINQYAYFISKNEINKIQFKTE